MAKSLIKLFKGIRGPPLRKIKEIETGEFTLCSKCVCSLLPPKLVRETQTYNRLALNLPFIDLPTELWFEILSHIGDKHTLVCLTQVNRALCEVAEPALYNAISLQWDATEINKLCYSIHSCPHRAGYVFNITLVHVDEEDVRLRDSLPSFLNSLQSLRHLRIEEIPSPNTDYCIALSSVRLPELRTFIASMRSTSTILLDFLAAHEKLQEIDLRTTYIYDEPLKSSGGTALRSSLRTLTCRTPFFSNQPPIPPNLTHLYRPAFLLWHLPLIATLAGPQLVSLRLGNIFPFEDFQPWSLVDIVSKFPRLRFLHVNMAYVRLSILIAMTLFIDSSAFEND